MKDPRFTHSNEMFKAMQKEKENVMGKAQLNTKTPSVNKIFNVYKITSHST